MSSRAPVTGGRSPVSTIDAMVRRSDYLRRSPFTHGGAGGHKEWLHFCIHGDGVDLLVNFSLVDDVRPDAPPGTEFARITVLARHEEWDGAIERFDRDVRVVGGAIDMRFGDNHVRYEDGVYRIRVRLTGRPITADLELRPLTVPAIKHNIRLDEGPPINWVFLPRLAASGTARIGDRAFVFDEHPAYHDHNWGHFLWGRDFAWEWAYALPDSLESPWALVFVRLNNRARTRCYMQGLFLWKGPTVHRIFRARDLAVRHEGFLSPKTLFKIPRPMALVSPGTVADVPARATMHAEADGDELTFDFQADDVAQVLIPSDTDASRVTIINEVVGTFRLSGNVLAERIDLSGSTVFEFIRG